MHLLKQSLRRRLLFKRRALIPQAREHFSSQITKRLARHPDFIKAQHLGLYLSFSTEVNTKEILTLALGLQKRCYAPSIAKGRLTFVRVTPHSQFSKNQYGILEPQAGGDIRSPLALDLVLLPLVGFDPKGHRLGMGGGFYDRAFQRRAMKGSPTLIGLAYECQRVNSLPRSKLDVKLDYIVTESGLYKG